MRTVRGHGALVWLLVGAACGTSIDSTEGGSARQAVIGGQRDTTDRGVLAVMIQPNLSSGIGFCSGFLVAPNLVMTARHCVSEMDQAQAICADEVIQGTTYTATRALAPLPPSRFTVSEADDVYGPVVPMRAVRAVHVPPAANGAPNCGNDVALLELAAPLSGATPLALRVNTPATTETFTAIGYGYDGAVVDSDGVRRTRSGLGILTIGETHDASGGRVRATAQDWVATLGPCGGDSGAPAVDLGGKVIGVMSRGSPTVCQQMIYTQVAPFREWVKQIAREAAARGGIPLVGWVAAETMVDAGPVDAGPDVTLPATSGTAGPVATLGCSSAGNALSLITLGALCVALRRRRGDATAPRPSA